MSKYNIHPSSEIAQQHYQAGRLVEAEAAYRNILEQQPEQIEALSWLGLIADQLGKLEESVAYYERLLRLKPGAAETHSNLGAVLSRLGRMEAAIAQHQQALTLKPTDAEAHYNLAVTLYQNRQLEQAIAHYRQAVMLNPGHVSSYANLALALYGQGKLAEAIVHYQRALALNPNHLNANNGLAVALYHQGNLEAATEYCQKAIALDPNYFSAYNNLGTILQKQGRLEQAMAQYQQALAINPNYASAHDNLGTIYQERGNLEQAIAHYRQAIALEPSSANAYNNLGSALKEQGKLAEAIACCQQAIRLQPSHADAHNNYGSSLVEQGRFTEAIAHYEAAIQHRPDHVNAHLNLGIILLLLGDFQRGFPEYHWRWRSKQCPPLRYPNALWDGSDLTGKIILLTAEQGFGDTIQFARYAPLVAQRGGCVVIACQKPLLRLLETLPGIDRCVDRDKVDVETHCHAPLLDLPLLLGTTVETIPANIPYLRVPGVRSQESGVGSRESGVRSQESESKLAPSPPPRVPASPRPLHIGFVWASNPDNSTAKKRTCPLNFFLSLLGISGVTLYSLQKDPSAADMELLAAHPEVVDLQQQLQDFGDTAAAIAQLDLVISVDTAVAHLAGALGKPVWTLLPFVADWRWLLHRQDTPWYPTMRLFRQGQEGDWEGVFEQVRGALLEEKEAAEAEGERQAEGQVEGALRFGELNDLRSEHGLRQCRHGVFLCQHQNPLIQDSLMGRSLALYGEWLEGEVALFQSLLQPGDTLVEVGAGIGAHTVALAKVVGETGQVWAIAPQRLVFQRLCANLALNGLTNAYACQVVLEDMPGTRAIAASDDDPQSPVERVQVVTLDSLELARCRLLKLASGQAGVSVFQGATATLQRCQPVLYLEDLRSEAAAVLLRYLDRLGYDLYWHSLPLYNSTNFFQNRHNAFGEKGLTNVLGFHRAQGIIVNGMQRVILTGNSIP